MVVLVWFYEHTTRYDEYDKKTFPRLASWPEVYHRGRYDAVELVAGIEEHEVCSNFCLT